MAAHTPQQSNVSLPSSQGLQQSSERAPSVLPLPLHNDLLQIMDTHDSSFITREQTVNSDHTRDIPVAPPFRPPMHHDASYGPANGSIPLSGNARIHNPHTPVGPSRGVKVTTPSSADANRNTLAKDIIRALRPPSTKRKRKDSQGGESTDHNVSSDSPLVKKSRAVPALGISHREGIRGVTNNIPDVRDLREGSYSTSASLVQQPLPLFNAGSAPADQSLQTNLLGQPSSHHPLPNLPVQPSSHYPQTNLRQPSYNYPPAYSQAQPSPHYPQTNSQAQPSSQYLQGNSQAQPSSRYLQGNSQAQPSSYSPQANSQAQPSSRYPQANSQAEPSFHFPQTNSQGQPSSHNHQITSRGQSSPFYLQMNSQGQSSSHYPPTRPQWGQWPPVAQSHHQQYTYLAGQPNRRPQILSVASRPYPWMPITLESTPLDRHQPPGAQLLVEPSEARLLHGGSGGSPWRGSQDGRVLQARSSEAVSSAILPQNQVVNLESVSIPSISAASLPARHSSPPAPIDSASPPKAPDPRPPLFLPSSESPPPSRPGSPLPSRRSSGLIPVVELGSSLRKLKSKPRLVQDVSSTSQSLETAVVDSVNDTQPLFGRPTGALAAETSSNLVRKSPGLSLKQGLGRSRSQVYVLIPRVDKTAWLIPRESTEQNKTTHLSQKAQTTERKRHSVEDSFYVKDFARRLIRRRCLWKGCQAILDSTEKILKHVKIMHGGQDEDQLFRCHWKECHSNSPYADSDRLIRHLQWHVTARMYCAYEGCDFQTQLADPLAEHVADEHDENDVLRPIAVPSGLVASNHPAPVKVLPSYMSVPRQVAGRAISKDRHQKIGPWVLQRISGKIDTRKGAVSAAVPLRPQRLARQVHPTPDEIPQEATQFELQDEYEFTREEIPARSFKSLIQLPHTINDIDAVDGYLVDNVAMPLRYGPKIVNAPPSNVSEQAAAAIVSGTEGNSTISTIAPKRAVSEEVTQGVVKAVREDVDSREVEALL